MTNSTPFVFFGTPYVARDTLEHMHEAGYTPSLIVTSPDAPRGRGLTLTPSEAKEWGEAHGIPVFTPERIDEDAIKIIASYDAPLGIAVAYGKILPEALISSFPLGVLNVHYSLLPKYRGASPVEAALLSGETETGVTIQRMVYALDAGDVLVQESVSITDTETTKELRARLITLGANLLISTLPGYVNGSVVPVPQDHTLATHAGKIKKEEGELQLSGDSLLNWRKYRAYAESPGTYFFAERGEKKLRVKIREATFSHGVFSPTRIVPEGKGEQSMQAFLEAGYVPV